MNRTNLLEDAQSTTLCISVIMSGVAPRMLPLCVLVLLLFTFVRDLNSKRNVIKLVFQHPVMLLGALFCLYAALSSLWSYDRALSATTSSTMLVMIFSGTYISLSLAQSLKKISASRQVRFLRAIPIGGTIALAYLLFEILSGLSLAQAIVQSFPDLVGDSSVRNRVRSGPDIYLNSFYLNKNVAAAVLLMPAILVSARLWLCPFRGSIMSVVMMVIVGIVTFFSESETAKVALVAAILVAALNSILRSYIHTSLAMIFVCATLFAVPIARLPHSLNVHALEFLPFSARDRVVIWKHNSDLVTEHPIIGLGARATRALQDDNTKKSASTPQLIPRSAWHPHNMFLQIWLELGLVGALLFLSFCLSVIGCISKLKGQLYTAGLSTTAIMITYASFGWGFWQTWYQAALIVAVVGLVVSSRVLEHQDHLSSSQRVQKQE